MQATLLPLFPLPLVMFPRVQAPLHIFEDRYKEVVGEAIRNATEFGIVLAKDEGIVNAGCTVIVDQVTHRYPDGRMDIVTAGVRRFEITGLNDEKVYLRGEVEFFDDDDAAPAPAELCDRALERYRDWLALGEVHPFGELVLADPQLSFQLAHAIPDLDFRQLLLSNRSEVSRLKQVVDFLLQSIPKRRQAIRMKQLAPTNGHGQRPVEG